jgi:hypothetical protein
MLSWSSSGSRLTLIDSFVSSIHEHWELASFPVEKKLELSRMAIHRFPLEQAQEALCVSDAAHSGRVVLEWL